jgi:hypothetical protein
MDDKCEYVELVAEDSRQGEVLLLGVGREADDPSKVAFVGFQLAQVRHFINLRLESKTTY